jgi:hypothetical protein
VGSDELRAVTPALLTGSEGHDDVARGQLGDCFDTLTHHVFAEGRTRRDSTVVVGSVPEIVGFVRFCRKAGEVIQRLASQAGAPPSV